MQEYFLIIEIFTPFICPSGSHQYILHASEKIIYCHEGPENFKPAVHLLCQVLASSQTPSSQAPERFGENANCPSRQNKGLSLCLPSLPSFLHTPFSLPLQKHCPIAC